MFSRTLSKLFLLSLVLIFSYTVPTHANSGGGKEEVEKKEGEEGASGEAEVSESHKKQISEATELQTKVQALKAKIKTKEENINHLIEEKNHTKNAERVKEIIEEMVTEHKEMSKMIVEYEQNRSLLRYRYPEKGFTGTRSYERMEVKPLDQMENQMSVEAKLNRNLKTVRSQYGEPAESKNKKKKARDQKDAEAPSLTEPIVLQK